MKRLLFGLALIFSCKQPDNDKDKELAELRSRLSAKDTQIKSLSASIVPPQPEIVRKPNKPEIPPRPEIFQIITNGYNEGDSLFIQSAVLSHFETHAEAMSRTLGYDVLNDKGIADTPHVTVVVADFRRRAVKVYGRGALAVLRRQWGDLPGTAIFRADQEKLDTIAGQYLRSDKTKPSRH